MPEHAPARCHRTAIGIGQRYLLVGRGEQCLFNRGQPLHFFFKLRKLFLKPRLAQQHRFRRSSPAAVRRSAVSSWLMYRATLSSICFWRRLILPCVKLLSRLFTALNLLPSTATLAFASRPILRHNSTNCAQTFLIAGPLSLRKSAMVL